MTCVSKRNITRSSFLNHPGPFPRTWATLMLVYCYDIHIFLHMLRFKVIQFRRAWEGSRCHVHSNSEWWQASHLRKPADHHIFLIRDRQHLIRVMITAAMVKPLAVNVSMMLMSPIEHIYDIGHIITIIIIVKIIIITWTQAIKLKKQFL